MNIRELPLRAHMALDGVVGFMHIAVWLTMALIIAGRRKPPAEEVQSGADPPAPRIA